MRTCSQSDLFMLEAFTVLLANYTKNQIKLHNINQKTVLVRYKEYYTGPASDSLRIQMCLKIVIVTQNIILLDSKCGTVTVV